jgi:hypothetical protein
LTQEILGKGIEGLLAGACALVAAREGQVGAALDGLGRAVLCLGRLQGVDQEGTWRCATVFATSRRAKPVTLETVREALEEG